ncbi:helix-turn-helix domain-containing protein [Thiovibrio sp. JS02]
MTHHAEQTENSPGPEAHLSKSGETLGSYLKKHRLRQSKDLEQIAKETRIHASTLLAIEENNKKALPAEVFTRGFIKIYAQYLGVDPNEALSWHIQQSAGGPPPEEKINAQEVLSSETLAESPAIPASRFITYALVAACLILVGYWLINAFNGATPTEQEVPPLVNRSQSQPPAPPVEITPPAEQGVGADDDAETILPEGALTPAEESAQALSSTLQDAAPPAPLETAGKEGPAAAPEKAQAAGADTGKPQSSPAEKKVEEKQPAPGKPATSGTESEKQETGKPATQAAATPAKSAAASSAALAEATYVLEADFTLTTWLKIQIDDEKPRSFTYRPGDHPVWQAREKINLFVGNAGGVALTLNNKALPPMGKPGKTARLVIPTQN